MQIVLAIIIVLWARSEASSVTLVTALYDIGRGVHGRTFETYKDWFSKTLQFKTPMIVHVNSELVDTVKHVRAGMPTDVVVEDLHSTPYFYLRETVTFILKSEYYLSRIKDSNRLEAKLPMYVPLIFSKFVWLSESAIRNPFSSEFFFWVDAGLGRWPTGLEGTYWPNPVKMGNLGGRVAVQQQHGASLAPVNQTQVIWDNVSRLAAGSFGGSSKAVVSLRISMHSIFINMIRQSCVNNEQIAMFLLHSQNDSIFKIYPGECPSNCKSSLLPLLYHLA